MIPRVWKHGFFIKNEARHEKRRHKGLKNTRTGSASMFFHWLEASKIKKEIDEVNALYRSFKSYKKLQDFDKFIKAKDKNQYRVAMKATKRIYITGRKREGWFS